MEVIKAARVPAPSIPANLSVKEAIPRIRNDAGCAIAVVDGKRLLGTISKDDVLKKVVAKGLDPTKTLVRDVMRAPKVVIDPAIDTREALKLMLEKGQCYLPIVEKSGDLVGWLAVCNLFEKQVDDLDEQLDTLASYIGADGPGG